MLQDLALSSVLSTGQVTRLAFPSRRRAQRRLRAYLDHGLVRAALQGEAMHRDNVWTITGLGLEHLADRGAALVGVRSARVRPTSQKLAHALLVREVSVSLLVAEREGTIRLLDLKHDAELAQEPAFGAVGLVPDGFAVLEIEGVRRTLLWEAVTPRQPFVQVRAKLLLYLRAWSAGLSVFRDPGLSIVFVFEAASRLERFDSALGELGTYAPIRGIHVDVARRHGALLGQDDRGVPGFRPVR